MSESIRPLKQIRLSDQIVSHLRRYIAEEKLRPGDSLPSEVELARRFGVGRPTVREAINALAGSGLIEVASGRAPTVGSLTGDSVNKLIAHGIAIQQITPLETLQLRRFIEERSVALAAAKREQKHIVSLRSALEELKARIGDMDAFSEVDIDFHKTLAEASGNSLVQVITEGIAAVALASSLSGLRLIRSASEWDETYSVHAQIVEAVIDGDPERAEAAMRDHFDKAEARLLRGVRARPETRTSRTQ